jgi:hypothetical protein
VDWLDPWLEGAPTIGVTTSRSPVCKRGITANLAFYSAASRDDGLGPVAVAVVDSDVREADVRTRLELAGESSVRDSLVECRTLVWPALRVFACAAPDIDADRSLRSAAHAPLDAARREWHRVVFVDLPPGAGRPGPGLDSGIVQRLDALLVAVTPARDALAACRRHLGLIDEAKTRGHLRRDLRVGVVLTGDEVSAEVSPSRAAALLGPYRHAVVGSIPQLWGRSRPNQGFGPTMGFPDLEAAYATVLAGLPTESVRSA